MAVSSLAILLGFRNRILGTVVRTTGLMTLSATTTGYSRVIAGSGTVAAIAGVATFSTSQAGVIVNGSVVTVGVTEYIVSGFDGTTGATLSGTPTFVASAFTARTGSFVTDGFQIGEEIQPVGFPTNPADIVFGVTAGTLTTRNLSAQAHAAASAAGSRSLTVGAPSIRVLENYGSQLASGVAQEPVADFPYLAEEFRGAGGRIRTMPEHIGLKDGKGLVLYTLYGVAGLGSTAMRALGDEMEARVAASWGFSAGGADVRVRTDVVPWQDQIIPSGAGRAKIILTIPWQIFSYNVVPT